MSRYPDNDQKKATKLTVWGSPRREALIANAALQIGLAHPGLKEEDICRVLNALFLRGGESGVPRNKTVGELTVDQLADFMSGQGQVPEAIRSFTPSPVQLLVFQKTN